MTEDETSKDELITCLKNKNAILLVGSGSSVNVGYPSWQRLTNELVTKFAPELSRQKEETEADFVDRIVKTIDATNGSVDYHNFLDKRFDLPTDRLPYEDFHLLLVRLGFCGLVTTNYEAVIECAVRQAYSTGMRPYQCDPLNLCQERPYRIFEFLRSLTNPDHHRWVLHLHGFRDKPERLIVTTTDYQTFYGERPPFHTAEGKLVNKSLETLHRKVLWTLATTHPIVFLGFSMTDPFFTRVLEIINDDFKLGSDGAHFVITGFKSEVDKESIAENLRNYNARPIFYPVIVNREGKESHQALPQLVVDLAREVGQPIVNEDLESLNKRMWQL